MRTHPDIGLMIASCNKPETDLLQLARFWLCYWLVQPAFFTYQKLRLFCGQKHQRCRQK